MQLHCPGYHFYFIICCCSRIICSWVAIFSYCGELQLEHGISHCGTNAGCRGDAVPLPGAFVAESYEEGETGVMAV